MVLAVRAAVLQRRKPLMGLLTVTALLGLVFLVIKAVEYTIEIREGLLPPGELPAVADQVAALYAYLARTPSMLIGVSLPDAVGQRRPQNVPGTTDEYPNWRIPLADGEGRPVLPYNGFSA